MVILHTDLPKTKHRGLARVRLSPDVSVVPRFVPSSHAHFDDNGFNLGVLQIAEDDEDSWIASSGEGHVISAEKENIRHAEESRGAAEEGSLHVITLDRLTLMITVSIWVYCELQRMMKTVGLDWILDWIFIYSGDYNRQLPNNNRPTRGKHAKNMNNYGLLHLVRGMAYQLRRRTYGMQENPEEQQKKVAST